MTAARAEFARSTSLQNEFESPDVYAHYRAAQADGLVRERNQSTDPAPADDRAFYKKTWDGFPESHHLWPGGFEEAYAYYRAIENRRLAAETFGGVKPEPAAPLSIGAMIRRGRVPL
jgi:hypothetical protein